MAVYKPRGAKFYLYEFQVAGVIFRGSTGLTSREAAKAWAVAERRLQVHIEKQRRAESKTHRRRCAGVKKRVLMPGKGYADRQWRWRRRADEGKARRQQ